MNASQKKILIWAAVICLVYFSLFILPNLRGAQTEGMLAQTSVDEPVTYPYVVRMLTPASSAKELFERWIIYGDYHYGYPFYFLSALTVLPVRLMFGGLFTNHTALNLFLLRQVISVLPMVLACLLMVSMVTRLRRAWLTLALLLVVLSVRGIARNNIQWWHPDALSVLSVVVVLFLLNRDELRFGKNFYLAAAACGISAGIKLAGVYFFLAVGGCLIAGLLTRRLSLGRAVVKGGLFVAIMLGCLLLVNPVVYNAGARQEIVNIQSYKVQELSTGYTHDNPADYGKGPEFWTWTLTRWFGHPLTLAFLIASLLVGCFWGPNRRLNRLILGFCLPYSVYLLWFVAVKPDHYWLPAAVPMFATFFNIPLALAEAHLPERWQRVAFAVVLTLAAGFVLVNLLRPESGILAQFDAAMQIELTVH